MHEMGIVFQIVKTVEQVAEENQIDSIKSVNLEIGEVSGIVHSYLENCWEWSSEKSNVLKGTSLNIEEIPAITLCKDCNETYETVKHGKTCPNCKSENTYLIQGDEMNVKDILAE